VRQSKPNPIRKGPSGVWTFGRGRSRPLKGWGYVCECGASWFGHPIYSRSKAKDLLYGHRQSEEHKAGLMGV
jgi:hypothetical protein